MAESTSRLRDAITSGDFQPNERLVEKDLVALLGVADDDRLGLTRKDFGAA